MRFVLVARPFYFFLLSLSLQDLLAWERLLTATTNPLIRFLPLTLKVCKV